ncbi:hypothetical protein J6590_085026 [Homalodisca vitripennis]|nr:hypothetical protein J6590_085026 [Homalodisca vitripennis]
MGGEFNKLTTVALTDIALILGRDAVTEYRLSNLKIGRQGAMYKWLLNQHVNHAEYEPPNPNKCPYSGQGPR